MKVKYLFIVFLFNSCQSFKFGNNEIKNSTFKNQETIEFVNSQENIDRGYPFSEATIVNGIIYLSGETISGFSFIIFSATYFNLSGCQ